MKIFQRNLLSETFYINARVQTDGIVCHSQSDSVNSMGGGGRVGDGEQLFHP